MAEQADEKVRKIRSVVTVDHLRVSWNKPTTPALSFLTSLTRPRLMRYKPRAIRIPRPDGSTYTEPVHGWLYFNGSLAELKPQTKIVLHIPGGGFVAMSPRTHDDCLMAWAGKTGLPVLSLDYRKAPEFPYPYALNECYDVYSTIHASFGRCIGLSGETLPSVVVSGDSAGGNLATSLTLMILQSGSTDTRRWHGEQTLPTPVGLILMYPALDMNIGNWMTDEQMDLIRNPGMRQTNRRVLSRKTSQYHMLDPSTMHHPDAENSSDEEHGKSKRPETAKRKSVIQDDEYYGSPSGVHTPPPSRRNHSPTKGGAIPGANTTAVTKNGTISTRLAVPSLMSYVNDRILTPEMMRAMIILYIGPHSRPDFSTDYLLSPCLAPSHLLARFPKTYFLTGERDPLVDDTVIMAGRIRQAKLAAWQERVDAGELSPEDRRRGWQEKEWVDVKLVEGCSHGFLQFAGIFPEAWDFIYRVGRWYEDAFAWTDYHQRHKQSEQAARLRKLASERMAQRQRQGGAAPTGHGPARNHTRSNTASSSLTDDDERPLEMSMTGVTSSLSEKLARSSPAINPAGSREQARLASFRLDQLAGEHDAELFESPIEPPTPGAGFSSLDKQKRKSVDMLDSTDDLLGRRMNGLTAGLTGTEREQRH